MKPTVNRRSHPETKLAAAFFLLFSLTACGEKGSPGEPQEPTEPVQQQKEITFTIDAEGNIVIKDSSGKPIGEKCSTDPRSKDVCPIFEPGHKVQVKSITYISITTYSGSPTCQTLKINGVTYVIPSAAYCKKK